MEQIQVDAAQHFQPTNKQEVTSHQQKDKTEHHQTETKAPPGDREDELPQVRIGRFMLIHWLICFKMSYTVTISLYDLCHCLFNGPYSKIICILYLNDD